MLLKRFQFALLCAFALAVSPFVCIAKEPQQPESTQQSPQPDESKLVEHGHYINKEGKTVHSPAHTKSAEIPRGASAQCRDNTYSFSQHRSGTCSHHGGVAKWVNQ
jgi:hypothetical protein